MTITSSTSACMSNPNNMQDDIFLLTVGMSHPLSENQGVHGVNNGACLAPTMDTSARAYNEMTGALVQNGFVCAPVMNTTTRMQHRLNGSFFHSNAGMHQLMNGVIPNDGVVHVSDTTASNRMLNGMNGAGMYSQAANFALCSSGSFQQAMSTPFEIRMPHLDMMQRTALPPEASSFSFSQPITMDIDGILDDDFSEKMINGSYECFPGQNSSVNSFNGDFSYPKCA